MKNDKKNGIVNKSLHFALDIIKFSESPEVKFSNFHIPTFSNH
jgi:hypothetical protein